MDIEAAENAIDAAIASLTELRAILRQEKPQLPPDAVKRLEKGICLQCGEKITADHREVRGCHEKCHQQVTRAIRAGEITDAQAVHLGMWAPPRKSGRPRAPVTKLNQYLSDDTTVQDIQASVRKAAADHRKLSAKDDNRKKSAKKSKAKGR